MNVAATGMSAATPWLRLRRVLRSRCRIGVAVWLLMVLSGLLAGAAVGAAPLPGRMLIVGSEQDYPPFATGMTDATAGGFTVDLWKAVATEAGLDYQIRVLPFHLLLQQFKDGRIDVLINLAVSDERHRFAGFTVPHVTVHGGIFVRKGGPAIRSEDALAGKSIIVLNGDLAHDYAVGKGWTDRLLLVDTAAEGFRLLASGRGDAMLVSKLAGQQTLQSMGLDSIEALKFDAGFAQKFAFATQPGQADLLARLNEGLALTKSSGVYSALYEKWFGVYEVKEVGLRDMVWYIGPAVALLLLWVGYLFYQRKVERDLAQGKLQLAANVFASAREGITITDAEGTIIDVNDAFCRITGYQRGEVIGKNPRILNSGLQSKEFYEALWQELIEQGHWGGEVWNRRKNGEVYAELQTISSVRDAQGRTQQYVALFSDITAIKAHQTQLETIAHFDALTGLPNRLLLADRLQQAMSQALRRGQQLAVVYLDLDGFKSINDHHGHAMGDQFLVHLAVAMKSSLREGDTLARMGGDEFVAVLIDLEGVDSSLPLLNRLLAAAAAPVPCGSLRLQVSASIGVSFYPQAQPIESDQLLRQADQAMYQAKMAGKNRYHLFDALMDSSIRVQLESLERIRLALARGEFVLHYQPKVHMRSGAVVGAEALIRWQHPERGLLSPAEFLPVIEDHPLAVDVGEWVLDTALQQIRLWQAAGLALPVSVNISARQLQQSDFVQRLQAILARHPQVAPEHLELEILETSALADLAHVSQVVAQCSSIGVPFALDDFGTGYSSLIYLKRLRVALIKIDQSFVRDMLDDPDDLLILKGVIGLATAFNRAVIAEGVETVAHGTALLALGCDLAQGYGIARPMPADQLPAWAASWRPDAAWTAARKPRVGAVAEKSCG
jgi:diguanylate cyclase (GGDEF)-like protein/PAS domain S-box-containing protein